MFTLSFHTWKISCQGASQTTKPGGPTAVRNNLRKTTPNPMRSLQSTPKPLSRTISIVKPELACEVYAGKSLHLAFSWGKHIARILPVEIITCFRLIALSLHVQPGDLPSYSSILVNARCRVQVVNCCFGSSVLTLARFFLLPLWQLLLVFAGF